MEPSLIATIVCPRNISSLYCYCTSWAKRFTTWKKRFFSLVYLELAFSVRIWLSVACSRPLSQSWLWKTKIYVWEFKS